MGRMGKFEAVDARPADDMTRCMINLRQTGARRPAAPVTCDTVFAGFGGGRRV